MDSELAGARAEEIARDADVVAQIEQLVKFKGGFAHGVLPDIDLQALAVVLQHRKAGPTLAAVGHDAAGNGKLRLVGFERFGRYVVILRANCRNAALGLEREAVRVGGCQRAQAGLLAQSGNLLQLFLAFLVELLFKV